MDFTSIFTNLSSEYPVFLDTILWVFAAIGMWVSAGGVIAIVKMGKRDSGLVTPGSHIAWRLIGGSSMVDLSLWTKAWSGTLWANSDPMGISEYSGGSSAFEPAIMAAIGILVLTGYVTLGRAYLMATKLGTVSIESRGDLMGSIFARIIAGSALVCTVHIAMAINASTGFGFFS